MCAAHNGCTNMVETLVKHGASVDMKDKVNTIRESVDSLCRDGTDTPIVRVHTKAF